MYQKIRRILAAAAVIFLISLYLVTFVSALLGGGLSSDLFKICIFCSAVIPAGIYGFLLILRLAVQRKDRKQTDDADQNSDVKRGCRTKQINE